ncbi:type I-E CRISPR-associated protein Cse2/CasB [Geobacter sp.]|uniref:type I-E CRISPR-associated protein Cse2/CasB n=1 Tax=Geobacter sp. TaxID=46610 RepID=UPI0026302A52|nr:type I-E CRISPR-associated protein Cse2/CasB [Geobacter sp.]
MSNLLERLRRCKDDRGMMANLRCILVENKKHRAWPALNRLGVAIDDHVAAFVAGLYATHPEETSNGNFGVTCKAIEQKRGDKRGDDNKLTPTERRFQHLLAAGRDEVLERAMRMVLMAKSQGVPVNYAKLESDLRFWTERTKTEWAAAFWAPGAEPIGEEAI